MTGRVSAHPERGRDLGVRVAAGEDVNPEFDLIPVGEHRFNNSDYRKDKLIGIEVVGTWVFQVRNGHAAGFEFHGFDDRVMARGKLEPR